MSEKIKGHLKWFDQKKGYGFCTKNGTDYFVHVSELGQGILEGDEVMFEIEQTEKGFSAINVERFIGE
jgi:CspA family cold shock protein